MLIRVDNLDEMILGIDILKSARKQFFKIVEGSDDGNINWYTIVHVIATYRGTKFFRKDCIKCIVAEYGPLDCKTYDTLICSNVIGDMILD